MKKIFLLSLLCVLFTTSCTITEKIHFSDEEPGNVKYTIDLSMFKEYADDESLNLAEKIDSNLENYNPCSGISLFFLLMNPLKSSR